MLGTNGIMSTPAGNATTTTAVGEEGEEGEAE
jgi:hypothetical protein